MPEWVTGKKTLCYKVKCTQLGRYELKNILKLSARPSEIRNNSQSGILRAGGLLVTNQRILYVERQKLKTKESIVLHIITAKKRSQLRPQLHSTHLGNSCFLVRLIFLSIWQDTTEACKRLAHPHQVANWTLILRLILELQLQI